MSDWSPDSWRGKATCQDVAYPDPVALDAAVAELALLPPLVTVEEIERLKAKLAQAAEGKAFLLQGGDCAESFDDCSADRIEAKIKVLLQMSVVLVHGTRTPVVRVGRIAGQYAKPRSAPTERRGEEILPSYRGEIINRSGFTSDDRRPDPTLLLRGYQYSALTLNFVRALAAGGFADLHHPENWDLGFARHSQLRGEYERIVDAIRESIAFMEAIGGADLPGLRTIELYTSHEALALQYEMAQTRRDAASARWYLHTAHAPWIGMRTAHPDCAHVEFARGIANPIGLKVGHEMSAAELEALLDILHPDDEPGRLVLIHRFGADRIRDCLPPLIECVRKSGKTVLWCADPMHGNTETTAEGLKTRHFDAIVRELEQAFDIHRSMSSRLGGVHLELTGENVTECVGGARGIGAADLARDYRSRVDPRLNYEQALEVALRIARRLRDSGATQ